jgi:hypothetical protein
MRHFTEEPGLYFIKKPYTATALAQKLRSVVERRF